jgi:hypothetical protein
MRSGEIHPDLQSGEPTHGDRIRAFLKTVRPGNVGVAIGYEKHLTPGEGLLQKARQPVDPDKPAKEKAPKAVDPNKPKPVPWQLQAERMPEHPSLISYKGREYLMGIVHHRQGQPTKEHDLYRHGHTPQYLTPEEEQELKAHFLEKKRAEPIHPLLNEEGKPLPAAVRYPNGVHYESAGRYRIGVENPDPANAHFRVIPVDQIHKIRIMRAEGKPPGPWHTINERSQTTE